MSERGRMNKHIMVQGLVEKHAKPGIAGVMAQVNFTSGNRVSGMLTYTRTSDGGDDGHMAMYELAVAAQTADAKGQPQGAIATHHFDIGDVEAVVLLTELATKPLLFST